MPDLDAKTLLLLCAPLLAITPPAPPITGLSNQQALSVTGGSDAADKRHAFAALYRATQRRRGLGYKSPRPPIAGRRITSMYIYKMSNSTARFYFGFTPAQIFVLIRAMHIPPIIARDRTVFLPIEAFCLLLARLRHDGNIFFLMNTFHRAQSSISLCVNRLLVEIDDQWSHLLDFDHEHLLHPERLSEYADAFVRKGSLLDHVWGIIDCTIRRICRPSQFQRQAYNGYKKQHALKYQAVVIPNGLFGHLFGPVEGRRADGGLLQESRLLEQCRQFAIRPGATADTPPENRFFWIYGDPAYGLSNVLISPFADPDPEEQQWNSAMSRVRIEVEHAFGIV